jgi:DNA-binding XRE family transcriptional regulator
MNLQTIKSIHGKVEYVLLPINTFNSLRDEIMRELSHTEKEYELFNLSDYVDNPVARLRIEAGMTQEELAHLMSVTQAYISKIENQNEVSLKVMKKVMLAIDKESRGQVT